MSSVGGRAGHRLDPAQAGADARLAGDEERADLPRPRHVRPAAQLPAVAVDLHDPNGLGDVLLAEEHVGPERLRSGHRHRLRRDLRIAADLLVHTPLDLAQDIARGGALRWKVEAQPVGRDVRASLLRLLAEHVTQRPMEEMGGGVVAGRCPAPISVNFCARRCPARQLAVQRADVDDRVPHALRVLDGQRAAGSDERPTVADLPAPLRVERRPVQHG